MEGHGDSTLHRLAQGMGFHARVEPLLLGAARRRRESGWWDGWGQRRRLKRLAASVNARLGAAGIDGAGWDRRDGECIVYLRIEKLGLLEDLRSFARQEDASDGSARFPHLLGLRERNALGLPLELPAPLAAELDGDPVPVFSAPRLRAELEALAPALRQGEGQAAVALANMMHASESDISKLESQALSDPLFWVRFGYTVLTKLARAGTESRLPIIFA